MPGEAGKSAMGDVAKSVRPASQTTLQQSKSNSGNTNSPGAATPPRRKSQQKSPSLEVLAGGKGSVMEAIPSKAAAEWAKDLLKDGWDGKEKEHRALRRLQPTIANFTRNMKKNRDPMVPLFDENRVILHGPEKEKVRKWDHKKHDGPAQPAGEDYIHASWINFGTIQPYILTQLPLHQTIPDFWQMVWQENVCVIVCLQDLTMEPEDERYFPLKVNDSIHAKAKEWSFTVENRTRDGGNSDAHPDWTVRQLQVSNEKAKETPRRLTHISYLRWPESEWDLPPDSVLKLVDVMGRVNLSYGSSGIGEAPRWPIIIHCLNGATRSGTLAALAIAAETLDASGLIVVQDVVKDLRLHRYGAVPNINHYLHINRRLLDHALKEGVIKKDDPLVPIVTKALNKAE